MTVGIAVVGSGIFVQESHLPGIEANSDILSLKAIYSRSLSSAQALQQKVSTYHTPDLYASDTTQTLTHLLQRKDISAIIIALPIPSQPTYIKQALLAGKHVLSEKPIAKDMATAHELLEWYHANIDVSKVTWSVAENFRFLSRFQWGAERIQSLGEILSFRVRMHVFVKPGSKYYETSWRKTPEYQGGFLLDGGVHFIAGMRSLLGKEAKMVRCAAFTTQLREHLPPIDTVDATVRLANGRTGIFSVSFGTTSTGVEYVVACREGVVDVGFDRTTVKAGEKETVELFPEDGNGVRQELRAWGEAISLGKRNPLQSPEEALADLEVLEAMIKSGEQDGKPFDLELQ